MVRDIGLHDLVRVSVLDKDQTRVENHKSRYFYGTVRKIEITEKGDSYYVQFQANIEWMPFSRGQLDVVELTPKKPLEDRDFINAK